jgi:hypothetical protein
MGVNHGVQLYGLGCKKIPPGRKPGWSGNKRNGKLVKKMRY